MVFGGFSSSNSVEKKNKQLVSAAGCLPQAMHCALVRCLRCCGWCGWRLGGSDGPLRARIASGDWHVSSQLWVRRDGDEASSTRHKTHTAMGRDGRAQESRRGTAGQWLADATQWWQRAAGSGGSRGQRGVCRCPAASRSFDTSEAARVPRRLGSAGNARLSVSGYLIPFHHFSHPTHSEPHDTLSTPR